MPAAGWDFCEQVSASAVSGSTTQGCMTKGSNMWTMTGSGTKLFSRTAMRSSIFGMALAGKGQQEWRLVLYFKVAWMLVT